MKSRIPTFGLALALAASPTHAIAERDDAVQTVKELVTQGSAEYAKQHWDAARVAFLKAWEVKEHYAIAGSLADVEMKLGRYRDAAVHLKYALASLPPEHPEKRADAEASLKECRAHLSAVRVSVSGMLVLVKLDGRALPFRDMGAEILLDPGPHKLEAEQHGYAAASREFTAIAGETREIRLDLVPLPTATHVAPEGAMRPDPQSKPPAGSSAAHYSPRTWTLIGGGAATVVAAGVGTFFTLRYFALKSDAESLRNQTRAEGSPALVAHDGQCSDRAPMRPAACDQLGQTVDSRVSAGNIAGASLITAGALGVATVATWLLWPTAEGGSADKRGHVSITPWLVGARGAAIQGDF